MNRVNRSSPVAAPGSVADEGKIPAREILGMAGLAVFLRIALLLVSLQRYGYTVLDVASLRDGRSYLAFARALLGDFQGLTEYDRRVLPGYPALIGGVHLLGVPLEVAAIGTNWICVGLVVWASVLLFRDRRIGWAMATLTPTYVGYSTMGLSEPSMMVFSLFGLILARRGRAGAGGLLLGLAGMIRPVACFPALGFVTAAARKLEWRRILLLGLAAGASMLLVMQLAEMRGLSVQEGLRIYRNHPAAYDGRPFGWPFESLIMTPLTRRHVPVWRIVYAWAHAAAALAGCALLIREWWKGSSSEPSRSLTLLCLPWLVGNTLFVLCLDHIFGFQELHRFVIPALPPLFWAFRRYLPERRWIWMGIAAASFTAALIPLSKHL